MATKLIQLEDGILVEVDVLPGEAQQISGGLAEHLVDATLDKICPILVKTCRPVMEAWKELEAQVTGIEQAEVELGLSFETEGNLYIAKSTMSANLIVKLVIKPKS